jgi:hypothetical protein
MMVVGGRVKRTLSRRRGAALLGCRSHSIYVLFVIVNKDEKAM